MTRTLAVEGDVDSSDTIANLTTQGSVTAPSLVVPTGVSKIDKIIANAAADVSGAGDSGFLIRLGGSAVIGGEQVIAIGSCGGSLPQAGSDVAPKIGVPTVLEGVDIAVKPSEVIRISAEMTGDDLGTSQVGVTLVFA